jgi:hypothetical protein
MSNRTQEAPLQPITTFQTGARAYSDILSGFRTGFIDFEVSAVLTLAGGPATIIRNDGSLLGLFDAVGLEENGDDIVNVDPRALSVVSAAVSANATGATRLRALADGVYTLRETIRLPFAWPLSGAPWETAHVERDPSATTRVFWVANNNAANIVTTAGTATISSLVVRTRQTFDDLRIVLPPYYVPKMRMMTAPVSGAASGFQFKLPGSLPQRGIVIYADTNVGIANDVITQARIIDDMRAYVGPNMANFGDLSRSQVFSYGGALAAFGGNITAAATAAPGLGTYFQNWQDGGRLSMCYNPRKQGENLRVEADVLASVMTGATSQNLKALVIELDNRNGTLRPLQAFNV